QVRETADPALANGGILELGQLATKQMPDVWTMGKHLGFDVRVRPVMRLRKPMANPRPGKKAYGAGSEVDAFVVEAQKNHPDHRPRLENGSLLASGMQLARRDRPAVYKDWLAARLGAIAQVDREKTELVAFERSRVSRGHTSIEGPDATFHGELTVKDPEKFQTLLARGVGRHCAFGYGMLLLRPPRRR
ncbi:MAG: type I-E CRISPR-associated protein Cas6/Cse3/CasE, partial [Pseudomonadota bacterium]